MSAHSAVVTVTQGGPLEAREVPTPTPTGNQILVRSEWTASTPLDLHQADGHLLVKPPQVLGDGVAGTVVSVGPDVKHFAVGDKVFGFTWRNQSEKAHQEYVLGDENVLAKLPEGFSMEQAVTLPNNSVTAWHTLTFEFGFDLPWPKPEGYVPEDANEWILVWGGSSSVGQYMLQILKWYGYKKVIATASKAQHAKLERYGATACFNYRQGDVAEDILKHTGEAGPKYIVDCIGSQSGSVQPLSKIAKTGSKVAIMLPVIVKDAAQGVKPEYEMDVNKAATWGEGVNAAGVRTHFYTDNKFLAENLQREIMPEALRSGIVEPNEYIVVEGKSMLGRAEKALGMLRRKEVSGKRLVWRVSDDAGA